jgi:hypothetical protein
LIRFGSFLKPYRSGPVACAPAIDIYSAKGGPEVGGGLVSGIRGRRQNEAAWIRTATAAVAAACSAARPAGLDISAIPYRAVDTLVVALKVSIPPGLHLCGNPLGPGIGKPLRITPLDTVNIRWLGIAKTPARKFNPGAGEWIWAYKKNACFFLKGVLNEKCPETNEIAIAVEGLLCDKSSCFPSDTTLSVTIHRTGGKEDTGCGFAPDLRKMFEKSEFLPAGEWAAVPLAVEEPGP